MTVLTPFYRGKKKQLYIFGHFVGATPITTLHLLTKSARVPAHLLRRGPYLEVHKLPELNPISATSTLRSMDGARGVRGGFGALGLVDFWGFLMGNFCRVWSKH